MRPSRGSCSNNRLLFIHIPKTAGATFRSLLARNYRRKDSFVIHDLYPEISLEYLHGLSSQELNNYGMIAGHGAHYLLPKVKDFRSIIFLRDPVAQIISSYYHVKRSPHSQLHQPLSHVKDLKGYYEFLTKNDGFNMQTMYLARDQQDFIHKKRFMKISRGNYDKALQILEKINYVFLTEYFDEALYIIQQEFDLKHLYYTYKNRSPQRQSANENAELLSKIKEEQYWDYKLYEYARYRYQDLRNRYSSTIEEEVMNFKIRNRLYNNTLGKIITLNDRIINMFYTSINVKRSWKIKPEYGSKEEI